MTNLDSLFKSRDITLPLPSPDSPSWGLAEPSCPCWGQVSAYLFVLSCNSCGLLLGGGPSWAGQMPLEALP